MKSRCDTPVVAVEVNMVTSRLEVIVARRMDNDQRQQQQQLHHAAAR
jgi:hypothetical protein